MSSNVNRNRSLAQAGNHNGLIHGHSQSAVYRIWTSMKCRCNCPSTTSYPNYGGRGITVCERWSGRYGFNNFLADMGERPPGMELERKNNDLGYSKENCIWADRLTQSNNKTGSRRLTHDGVTQTLTQWARQLGVAPQTIHSRLFVRGWSIDKALTTPPGRQGKRQRTSP